MSLLHSPIDTAIANSVVIPLEGVAHDPESYLSVTSRASIFKKYLHKYLRLWLGGQLSLERHSVPKDARILWIYLGKRNFGDANMDISGRALLKNLGYDIDLFTHPNLHELFGEDDIFGNVYSDVEAIRNKTYDFILLSEFNHPSIRFKTKHFRKLPYACLFRFFYGPARNQTCFSYAAINRLFDLKRSATEIEDSAKPYLHHHPETEQSVAQLIPGQPYLAVSIGGRDADRSYRHWPEFLRLLDERAAKGDIPATIMLLGSDNGLEMEKSIVQSHYKNLVIQSQVGKLSLLQSRVLVSRASVFIGCDGGLMHVAHSTSTPSVTLFRIQEPHHLWLTRSCHSRPIQSTGEDSDIAPAQLLHELLIALNQQPANLAAAH